jgi:hypothetical protein
MACDSCSSSLGCEDIEDNDELRSLPRLREYRSVHPWPGCQSPCGMSHRLRGNMSQAVAPAPVIPVVPGHPALFPEAIMDGDGVRTPRLAPASGNGGDIAMIPGCGAKGVPRSLFAPGRTPSRAGVPSDGPDCRRPDWPSGGRWLCYSRGCGRTIWSNCGAGPGRNRDMGQCSADSD